MIDNVRRYRLCVTESISHGIGATGTTEICNLMNSFTVSSCIYPQINEDQLARMSVPNFENRVKDFLKHANIESSICREKLLEESSFYDPNYEMLCKLNDNFIVYKFFDGVRIIDVGDAYGIIQYKAYPFGDNSENYNWETNPTFLGLDLNEIYVFEVRDFYNNEEFCKVSKTIPLNSLVQSTTQPLNEIQIFLSDSSCSSYCDTQYRCGRICTQPNLEIGERICVGFELSSEGSGNGTSCVEIYCQKGGVSSPQLISNITNSNISPQTGSFIVCKDDIIKYNLLTNNSNPGDCSCTYLDITGVDGLNSTIPSIDVGKCCVSLSDNVPVTDVTIFLQECSVTTNENRGEIKISPTVPSNKYVDVEVLAAAYACLGATSQVILTCCCTGGVWTNVMNHSNTNPQPRITTIRMNDGDRLCYRINADAINSGSYSEASIEIVNSDSSSGINTYIDYAYDTDIITDCILPTVATVSVCRQNFSNSGTCQRANGFINVSPSLSGSQNVLIDINSLVLCMGLNNSDSCAEIFCKPAGSTSFTEILSFNPFDYDVNTYPQTNAIVYRSGDQMCYNIYAEAFCEGSVAQSDVEVKSVTGINGVNAYLNNSLTKRFDNVYGLLPDQYGNISRTPIGINNIL